MRPERVETEVERRAKELKAKLRGVDNLLLLKGYSNYMVEWMRFIGDHDLIIYPHMVPKKTLQALYDRGAVIDVTRLPASKKVDYPKHKGLNLTATGEYVLLLVH